MVSLSPIARLWKILVPFHRSFYAYTGKILLYEGAQVADSFVLSLIILLYQRPGTDLNVWVFVFLGLLVWDELNMRLDNAVDWHIVSKHSFPILRHLKVLAMKKFFEMDIPWHHKHNSGALVGKVNSGIDKTQELLEGISWEFFPTAVQTVLSLIPLVLISPHAAIIGLVAGALFIRLSIKATKLTRPMKKKRHDLHEEDGHRSVENVQSVETAVIFGQTERLIDEYESLHSTVINIGLEEGKISIYHFHRWRIRILRWGRRLILLLWLVQLSQGQISVPMLFSAYTLMERLFHSFWRFSRLFDRATEAWESIRRLVGLLEEKPAITEMGSNHTVPFPPGISFKNVCFSYHHEYDDNAGAIHSLCLEVEPGSIVALVGPSGSGKTTMRKLIARLEEIQGGTIEIGGVDIRDWSLGRLRSLIATVPQGDDVAIFSATVRDNIAFSSPEASDEQVCEAAKLAGIHDFIVASLPEGYQTYVGERGHKLSGGQKQRIALARAILADRPILFFDEATSALDAITEREIQQSMQQIMRGKTVIVIAHRLSTVWNIADKIVVLDQGRKQEEGTHEELMTQEGLYAQMASLQLTT